jgi:hypothetical protein
MPRKRKEVSLHLQDDKLAEWQVLHWNALN